MLVTSFIVTKTNCSQFNFIETTGVYGVSNESGWGTPNYDFNEIQDIFLTITNITTGVVYENIEIDASANGTTELLFADLIVQGQTTSNNQINIPDGIYHFKYTILFDDNNVITADFYLLSLCTLECKIKKLIADYANKCCKDCKEDILLALFNEVMALHQALIYSYQCTNFSQFNKIYTNLTKLLKSYNCKNC